MLFYKDHPLNTDSKWPKKNPTKFILNQKAVKAIWRETDNLIDNHYKWNKHWGTAGCCCKPQYDSFYWHVKLVFNVNKTRRGKCITVGCGLWSGGVCRTMFFVFFIPFPPTTCRNSDQSQLLLLFALFAPAHTILRSDELRWFYFSKI